MPSRATMTKGLTKKQKAYLQCLRVKACNVSSACETFGISRETHYAWLKDPKFKAEYDAIRESLIDFAESQLLKNIQKGKESSLIFFLKTQGKKRGYSQKLELETEVKHIHITRTVFDRVNDYERPKALETRSKFY